MAHRHELTGAEWTRIAPLLPARQTRGTYYAEHRRILAALQRELAAAGRIDWAPWCIDGSHVRAHRVAAGAGENTPAARAPAGAQAAL